MKHNPSKTESHFTNPAVYKIKVTGDLSEQWSNRLGGMQIKVDRSKNHDPVSVLVGRINDQAALSGVLNTLYGLHVSILSVSIMKDEI